MAKNLSEEFKDQKINDLLEDYIQLENEIKSIPEKLSNNLHAVDLAIKNLPSNLEESIKNLVIAVEEVEFSAETTKNETQAALAALSQKELETTKTKITEVVNNSIDIAIKSSLAKANSDIVQLENKIQSLSSGLKRKDVTIMNFILAALVTVTLVGTVVGFMFTRGEIAKSRDDVNFYVKYIQKYIYAVDKLPEKYKKQINDEVLGDNKESGK
ncbi:TPA: hypothetical protein I7721_21430 [Vibrio vulnificus]|nr:hypothetical protein [Vibrio vulnificus]